MKIPLSLQASVMHRWASSQSARGAVRFGDDEKDKKDKEKKAGDKITDFSDVIGSILEHVLMPKDPIKPGSTPPESKPPVTKPYPDDFDKSVEKLGESLSTGVFSVFDGLSSWFKQQTEGPKKAIDDLLEPWGTQKFFLQSAFAVNGLFDGNNASVVSLTRKMNTIQSGQPQFWKFLDEMASRAKVQKSDDFGKFVEETLFNEAVTGKVSEGQWEKINQLTAKLNETQPELLDKPATWELLTTYAAMPVPQEDWLKQNDALLSIKDTSELFKTINKNLYEKISTDKNMQDSPWFDKYYTYLGKTDYKALLDLQNNVLKKVNPEKFQDMLFEKIKKGDSVAFVQMLPHMLTTTPTHKIQDLMRKIEADMDTHLSPKDQHDNEAEMMLLLRRPYTDNERKWTMDAVARALTSVTRFIGRGIYNVKGQTMKNWSDIGFLAHSFRFWKYDAVKGPGGKTLLESYGFKSMGERATDKIFGSGFIMTGNAENPFSPIDAKTLIEFRRGYILVSNTDNGTLVIRNSSLVFGRDTMPHAAVYSDKAMTMEDLKTLDPSKDERFKPILDRSLYLTTGFDDKATALLKEVANLKEDYRRWKFDSEVFEGSQFAGHQSPGLQKIRDLLQFQNFQNLIHKKRKPLPDLAFVHPDFPPYKPFARYPMTPQNMLEFGDFMEGKWAAAKHPGSKLVEFVQTGVNTGSELVLLDPLKSDDDGGVQYDG